MSILRTRRAACFGSLPRLQIRANSSDSSRKKLPDFPITSASTSSSSLKTSLGQSNSSSTTSSRSLESAQGLANDPFIEAKKAASERQSTALNWRAGLLFAATGIGLYVYFESEKSRVKELKKKEERKSVGKPDIGGPFNLLDQNGNPFTRQDTYGKHTLMYFGFTNCPDICPEELDKMSDVITALEPVSLNAIFFSCDPARDTVPQMKRYLADFHPAMIGLTGTYDEIKQTCKKYRVYFSTPPDATAGDDYANPAGGFVEAFGRNTTPQEMTKKVKEQVEEWKQTWGTDGCTDKMWEDLRR